MYYTYGCTYCTMVFYVWATDVYTASEKLYKGVKKHLIDYNEDHKENKMDDGIEIDSKEIRENMPEYTYPPVEAWDVEKFI